MKIKALENLVKINKLNTEPPDQTEFNGMVSAATLKLQDIVLPGLSVDSQFSLAYGAAHALSLAALRWHGYRSDARYLVFQCLEHTLGLEKSKWRVLDKCHQCRNLAEYEGHLDVDIQLLKELVSISNELLVLVKDLAPVAQN
ncbi:MAG: hypothetical protein KBT53_01550 [Porticoccus sp.]|nr:hypothetical protein [Porticoccus sp.]MBQ0807585.1 hypothetical protein [Porticoccus sp.]